jgi:ribosomal protein S18 acetylase RimI-like enzyme
MKRIKLFERFINKPDKHGNDVVWENDMFYICVNDLDDATYITLWESETSKKIGAFSLSSERYDRGKTFRKISGVNIDKEFRGYNMGSMLYVIALKYIRKDIDGLYSYLPDRSNKVQIPNIFKRLGGYIKDEDHAYIEKNPMNWG